MARKDNTPLQGDLVIYYDDDRRAYAATVGFVLRTSKNSVRPICNLAIVRHDGQIRTKVCVEPAVFDQAKGIWKLLNKWAWPEEVPVKDYNTTISPEARSMSVGRGEYIPTT